MILTLVFNNPRHLEFELGSGDMMLRPLQSQDCFGHRLISAGADPAGAKGNCLTVANVVRGFVVDDLVINTQLDPWAWGAAAASWGGLHKHPRLRSMRWPTSFECEQSMWATAIAEVAEVRHHCRRSQSFPDWWQPRECARNSWQKCTNPTLIPVIVTIVTDFRSWKPGVDIYILMLRVIPEAPDVRCCHWGPRAMHGYHFLESVGGWDECTLELLEQCCLEGSTICQQEDDEESRCRIHYQWDQHWWGLMTRKGKAQLLGGGNLSQRAATAVA